MPIINLLLGIAAIAQPPSRPVAVGPQVSAVLLVADAYGQRRGRRSDYLTTNMVALLVTLHDLDAIRLADTAQQNSAFESCFGPKRIDHWEPAVARCIGARLTPSDGGAAAIAILVNDTRSRSSAQQLTCVGGNGAIGEAKAHLADLFHPRPDIREGTRRRAMACIEGALGTRR